MTGVGTVAGCCVVIMDTGREVMAMGAFQVNAMLTA